MNINDIKIRETKPEDLNDIIEVETLAFNREDVVNLAVDLLTDITAEPIISLMAFYEGKAIGHILFTKAGFCEGENQPMMHILAPLAVHPDYQRKGVGGKLIEAGVELLRKKGSHLIFVLGHREYYPKYGFIPDAAKLGYPAPYPIEDRFSEYWMVRPISEKGFDIGKGKIACSEVLDQPEHWVE